MSASLAYRDDGASGANVYIGGIIDNDYGGGEDYEMSIVRITPVGAVVQAVAFEAYGAENN